MALTNRENYLRTAALEGGEWIPCDVGFSPASWNAHREELTKIVERHPSIFPYPDSPKSDSEESEYYATYRAGERFTDTWGCVWENVFGGLEGQVVGHPLADWSALATYEPPDPMVSGDLGPVDWTEYRESVIRQREKGELTSGGVSHGFLLMRLWYLRGFEQLMVDLCEGPAELSRLIRMVVDHNWRIVSEWLAMGVDLACFAEDLGTQTASIVSPQMFGRWIAPGYRELMRPCREAGSHVYLHSDGHIMDLIGELINCGVTILNPQDLCNGIDNLAKDVKGRLCIDLDLDRQRIVPYGTRQEIRELIREEVMKLGSPRGGLMLGAGIYPPTPPENVDALCCALEEFRTYWWDDRAC